MLFLLGCTTPEPTGAPMDGLPDDHVAVSTVSGSVTATISAGVLTLTTPAGTRTLAPTVVAPLALDSKQLVYALRDGFECDLYRVRLPDGEPERLTDWIGFEDRPSLSGSTLHFYSGRSGIVSQYTMDLDTRVVTQVSNVGIEHQERRYRRAPEGFVAPVSPR